MQSCLEVGIPRFPPHACCWRPTLTIQIELASGMRSVTSFALLALPLASAYHLTAGCASRGAPVARAASQMQMVPGENKQQIDSKDTYNVMMRVLLETNSSITNQISASYHMVDYAFLQKLDQRAESETDPEVAAPRHGQNA